MADDLINLRSYPTDAILGGNSFITPEQLNQPLVADTIKPNANGRLLPEPTASQALAALGMGLINADQRGAGIAGGIIDANLFYQNQRKEAQQAARQQRQDQLQEYEILDRIRQRQLAEMATLNKASTTARLKKEHPELADLIDLDPGAAAKVIAKGVGGGGGGPYGGNGLDAQNMNILIGGTKSGATDTVEYAAAYKKLSEPKVQVAADGSTSVVSPDMSAYAPPSGQFAAVGASVPESQGGALPPTADPSALPDVAPVDPNAPKQTTQNINGTSITTTQGVRQKWTGEQLARASFADRMSNSDKIIAGLSEGADEAKTGVAGYAEAVLSAIPSLGLTDKIGGAIVKAAATPEQQQYLNAAQEWIRAKLRKESGAAIGEQEMIDEYSTYFPTPGDSAEVIKQKAKMRDQITDGMKKESGGAYEKLFSRPEDSSAKNEQGKPKSQGMLDDENPADQQPDFSVFTPDDLQKLATKHNLTVEQVKQQLGIK